MPKLAKDAKVDTLQQGAKQKKSKPTDDNGFELWNVLKELPF